MPSFGSRFNRVTVQHLGFFNIVRLALTTVKTTSLVGEFERVICARLGGRFGHPVPKAID